MIVRAGRRTSGLALVWLMLAPISPHAAAQRHLSPAEANALVIKALEPAGIKGLRGFSVEQSAGARSDKFYVFEATWDNPGGSVVFGAYAVDRVTGDVWDAVVCREFTSEALGKIQRAIRKRIGLSDKDYARLKRLGPMC